jgi:primary-amine oxidase
MDCDGHNGRFWKIVNPNVQNALGQPTSFKLMPGENVRVFAHDDSSVMRRAGFMKHHFWVTPFNENEKYAAGDYPNQRYESDGLPNMSKPIASLRTPTCSLVYVYGASPAAPRRLPVMPCGYIGFMMKPVGFFQKTR